MITNHDEVTFGLLRYLLGGYRPSKTARLTMSERRIHGDSLESRPVKTGISRVTPRCLTTTLRSLPVILHITDQNPISEYSKGSWGLFV